MRDVQFWQSFAPLLAVNIVVVCAVLVFAVISKSRPKTKEIEDRHSSVILNKWIREFWFWFTHPIFRFFIYFKISPNAISIMGTVVALFSAVAFALGGIGLGGWLMVLGASLDLFDGRVARATSRSTLAGSYIDACMDRISEALTLSGIAYLYRNSPVLWLVLAVYLGSMLTSYAKAKGQAMGVDYSGGMMQRPERIVYLGAGGILTPVVAYGLFPLVSAEISGLTHQQLEMFVYVVPLGFVAVLCNVTALRRIIIVMKSLTKKQFPRAG